MFEYVKSLDFSSGFATSWCLKLSKGFDITEFLFLYLEIDENDL